MSSAPLVCVSVTDFAMQLVQREKRLDHTVPLVIVPSEQPGARILECNRAAAAYGVRAGMAYSHALSLSEDVRAGTVSVEVRRRADREIRALLQRFSPAVEASDIVEGVYWLDISGTQRLFGGIGPWLRGVGRACTAERWRIRVCRGWTRPGTMLAVLQEGAPVMFSSISAEHVWMRRQPLTALPLPERDQEHLAMVAFREIGHLVDAPFASVKARFSPRTVAFRQFCARAFDPIPIQSGNAPVENASVWRFEPPVMARGPVQRALQTLVRRIVSTVAERGEWVEVLVIGIDREREPPLEERIRCGRATRDVPYLFSLVEMRLDRLHLKRSFVIAVRVSAELSAGEFRQGEFSFAPGAQVWENPVVPVPSPDLLDRTIAALQAELGSAVCSRILIVPGRFPEDRFALVPISHGRELLSRTDPGGKTDPGGTFHESPIFRVRRILSSGTAESTSWLSGRRTSGPFLLSSAWWEGVAEHRVYEYRLQPDGREAWVYRLRSGGSHVRLEHGVRLQGYVE
ncbi:MAG: hypothetical protein WD492_14580 [Alkalispirochaeta sp.]